jgi:acyl-CoA thioester hydrolase
VLSGHEVVYTMAPMQGFDFVHRLTTRFNDLDGMGHVNNAVYLTYVEEARIAFLRPFGATYDDMILARMEIDYRSPLQDGEDVEVGVRCTKVGRTSFDLEYELRAGGRLVAEARSVQVAYSYQQAAPVPVPDAWRAKLEPGTLVA